MATRWRTILERQDLSSIPPLEVPGASVLDEYYWLNKEDPNYSLMPCNERLWTGCPYRWQIQSKPEGLHGDCEAVHDQGRGSV